MRGESGEAPLSRTSKNQERSVDPLVRPHVDPPGDGHFYVYQVSWERTRSKSPISGPSTHSRALSPVGRETRSTPLAILSFFPLLLITFLMIFLFVIISIIMIIIGEQVKRSSGYPISPTDVSRPEAGDDSSRVLGEQASHDAKRILPWTC